MTRMTLVAAVTALLLGAASGARMTGRWPYWLGDNGGVILYVHGQGFSEDQFSQFDPTLGNRVYLVNDEDDIECDVIQYLTTAERIVCETGPRTKPNAERVYDIVVYTDGELADGYAGTVQYGWWTAPKMETVTPRWSLPGARVNLTGWFGSEKYYSVDYEDPLETDPDSGNFITEVFLGGVPCRMVDENDELLGPVTERKLTCDSVAKVIGPMNASMFTTNRGSSVNSNYGLYVDSKDKLFHFHTYADVESVSPSVGSPGGGSVITITGQGFDPNGQQTKVEVGGSECVVQDITDDQIQCLTPSQQLTAPGPGERGLLVEVYEGEYFESHFWNEENWTSLSPDHSGYSSFVTDVAELKFNIDITEQAVGTVKGFFHPPHDGLYSFGISSGDHNILLLAVDGDPANKVTVSHWQEVYMQKDTPVYMEIRIRSRGSMEFQLMMRDLNGKFVRSQTGIAYNEKHRVRLNIHQVFEEQRVVVEGEASAVNLFMNGISSSQTVNMSNPFEVREELLDMTEQKCEVDFSSIDSRHYIGFENGTGDLDPRGSTVDDVTPYCGRKSYRLYRHDPRIYRQTNQELMVDANVHKFLCFAVSGNLQPNMAINFKWQDNNNRGRDDTFWFDHDISSDSLSWNYHCIDFFEVMNSSWAGQQYTQGAKLKVKNIVLPKPLKLTDEVYVDEVVFTSSPTTVLLTRPSALKQQGILVRDVVVEEEEDEDGYILKFETSNCVSGMPLLGVYEGEVDNSLIGVLQDAQTYNFSIGDAVVMMNRDRNATSPLAGTFNLNIQGQQVKDIEAFTHPGILESFLESALGTDLTVTRSGSCRNFYYDIEWVLNPGRKDLIELDDTNLVFDGEELETSVSRSQLGLVWHHPLPADFTTTYRESPHVTVRVNGYSARCSGICGFTYDASSAPTLTSASGTPGGELQHTLTLTGTGFTSSNLDDYSISVAGQVCTPTSVTPETQVVCDVSVWGGEHPVSLSMQPAGVALTSSPVTYTVTITVTDLSKNTGGTGGLYPITVSGSGFPDSDGWQAGAAKVFMGDNECLVTSGGSTQVTCTVPPGEGVVDVSVVIGVKSASLDSSFTYNAALSPAISSTSPSPLSVYGQQELTISGTNFGSSGSVQIGSEPCDVINEWSDTSVTCLTPSLSPDTYTLTLLSDDMGATATSVEYVLQVTSASAMKGSVKGGSLVKVGGTGFGSDCSRLDVKIGDLYQCEVTECSPETITCVTSVIPTNHQINNTASTSATVAWSPAVVDVFEGDVVTWYWKKTSENSQLKCSVCQVPSPLDDCGSMQGFNSGDKTASGSFTMKFPHQGTYYYAGQPVASEGDLVMRGQINVVRPQHQAVKVTVTLGGKEATYQVTEEEDISVDGCDPILESPISGCEEADPDTPDDGLLYFEAHTCYTPVINTIDTSNTHTVPGLSGVQVLAEESLTITGSGFGDSPCQVEVKVGDAACTVTSTSDTSVTCDLDDLDNLRSSAYLPLTVKVINRGLAVMDVSDYNSEGRVVVLPQVSAMTPTEGSMAGGTLVTITGSGLQGLNADPVVLLGATPCQVQSVESSSVTCLTPASATASSATLSLYVSGVPAKMDDTFTFSYSEALTPLVTDMSVEGEMVTLSGQRLGDDTSKLTVTLERQTDAQRRLDMQEEEEIVMMEQDEVVMMYEEEVDEHYLDDLTMSDEELEYMTNGYIDEEMADAFHRGRSSRRHGRHRKLSLVAELEELGFWGTFTGTGASSFEETVRLGAWRMAGTAPSPNTKDQEAQETFTRKKRSLEDIPTTYSCTVTSVSDSDASATCSGLPAGSYIPVVSLDGAGSALTDGVSAAASAVITTVTPISGSTNGGALLSIAGSGFIPGETSIEVGGVACIIEEESTNAISCRVAPGSDGAAVAVVVKVTESEDVTASSDFTYSSAFTPTLTSVTPSEDVISGDTLTLTGTGFALSGADPVVTVGGYECALTSSSETSLECTAPEVGAGSYEVIVRDTTHGDSNTQDVTFSITIDSLTPSSGSFGGAAVVVSGQGFDIGGDTTVTVCDAPAAVITTTSTTTLNIVTPPQPLSDSTLECDVVVSVPGGSSFTLNGGFTYDPNTTPSISSVEPKRGGTAGGTTLTITGSDFGSSGNTVSIGGSTCTVTSQGPSSITCVTKAHQGSGRFAVQVTVPGSGLATTDDNGIFFYIDQWGSVFTWGDKPVPSEGQLAVVSEGQTILLDESTPVLKMLLIQGGHLIFDSEATEELVLRAEYILVVDGGSLSIGSEEEPFMGPAVIEMYGNTQSIELPIYGSKVLAVRNGTLDLHGAHVPITWTHLAQTGSPGDTSITLTTPVTWNAGDKIVIATTQMRFFRNENEVKTIASVSEDGLTVTLTEPLEYSHISLTQTLGGRTVHTRAEVGLLSRNVKVRGAINSDFTKNIEACEEKFRPGQFKTQSCFNGRYGDEIGSDQFGATVMLAGKYPDQDIVGRIQYVEVTEAGQAFQLGRYPLHFHVVGNVGSSYIRGCAIHRTYNRAVTIHAANYLTVEYNVVFDNMGHAIFTEDGVEQYNVVQYNLAVYTRTSSSLLNVDVTPSSFWVVNPNNIFRHNAAAGGTHFGYWYRLERHPTGPSATNSYCPNNEVMGQFFNNTAHSMGRYGLWVFSMDGFHPKTGTCGGRSLVARFEDFTAWHCDRGAEVVFGTNLQFHNFVMLDNEHAGMEMVKVDGDFGEDDGPGIFNSLVVGHSDLGSGSCGDDASGIIAPKEFIFSIANVTFVNFDTGTCSALSGCSQCKLRQGGFPVQVMGLSFDTSPNKLKFKWEYETIWIDADGSLTNTVEANVVPSMGILPPDSCTDEAAFSINSEVPGAVCTGLKFLRINVKGPKTEPSSLRAKDIVLSNSHGNTSVPYRVKRLTTEGWMAIVFAGDTYDWTFDDSEQITNISYKADTRFLTEEGYFFVRHTFIQEPDGFGTTSDERESLDSLPDPNVNFHGDYYWNTDDLQLTYLVSYNETPSGRSIEFDGRDPGDLRETDFRVYRCQYEGCIPPTVPPVPTGRPDTTFRWSDNETWKEVPVGSGGHPTEDEYGLPVEGDEIVIPKGMWLIVDTETPSLARVYVYGTIEFEDTMDHEFEATIIYIQGGTVVAGFSSEAPFTHNLSIRLRGSLDPSDPDNEDMPMPNGVPNVGWKAIGVFGNLQLHGEVSGQLWHKLGATAEPGATTITLTEEPDASWLGKMIVVTATAKEATESEVRTVTDISGTTLTLDSALSNQHLGETHALSDGSVWTSITLSGEVGLLSRNIVVEGNTYDKFEEDSFGGRIVVSKLNHNGLDYVGTAQLDGVELRNMGQEGFTDLDDPRYSLAYVNLGTIESDSSYVKRSSFNLNYNTALGLLSTSNMEVEDNVIYHAIDSGIRDESGSNSYTGNLVTTVLFRGTYGDREETQNLEYHGAFQLDNAPNTVLSGNVVAGAEQAGFKTLGEPCGEETMWDNNEVHSTVFGVMTFRKTGVGSLTDCRRLNNFYAWRTNTAFYYQYYASSLITNVVSVDNRLGVNQLVYSPAALSHVAHPKTATTTHSLFVGASPSHTCAYQESVTDIMTFYAGKLWSHGIDGGNTAMVFGTMMSGPNMAPKKAFSPPTSYPALYGSTHIESVTFSNYDDTDCGRDIALLAHPESDDAIHPVFVEGMTFLDTPEDNYMFIPRAPVSRVNPSDCVDMDCDGHKKVVVRDMDGSLLGQADATAVSQAEFEWDGEERRGVGDYRIPVSLRQRSNGSEIEAADKFPNKGIVRDGSCNLVPSWQAWKCTSISHRMLVIESMDSDTEVRRLSPIALIANPGTSGYVDLLNGPMDRGWCFGYTCQERISTFYAVVGTEQPYEMAMTGTPPQVLRLHLLHAPSTEAVILRIFFPKTQRYDIYVDDEFVPPTNIDDSVTKYQLLPENPDAPEAFFPTLDDDVGTNYLQRSAKMVHVVLRGGHVVDIVTTPVIALESGQVVTEDEFFEDNILSNLADLLGVSTENIRITNIVSESSGGRAARQENVTATVSAEVASAPKSSLSNESNTSAMTGGDLLSFEDLENSMENAVNSYQEGAGGSVMDLKINDPVPPPKEAPPKATEETGSVVTDDGELFSDKQQKEEQEELEKSLETTEYVQPSSIVLMSGVPSVVVQYTAFVTQPSVSVLDEDGEVVLALGHSSDPWQVTAELSGGPENAVLKGTTSVPYLEGSATFHDLSISEPGVGFNITFTITYPSEAPDFSIALDQTFSAKEANFDMAVQYPDILQAGQPFLLSVQFVDEGSQMLLDADLFENQTIVGEVMSRNEYGETQVIQRIYWADGAVAQMDFENFVIEEPSVRYWLFVRMSVVPLGWYPEFASETSMVVYPSHLEVMEDSITKNLSTYVYGPKVRDDINGEMEDNILMMLMESVDKMAEGVYWGPVSVTNNAAKRGPRRFAHFAITGPEEKVKEAMYDLCMLLLPKQQVQVTSLCFPRARFFMRKLSVDGKRKKNTKSCQKLLT